MIVPFLKRQVETSSSSPQIVTQLLWVLGNALTEGYAASLLISQINIIEFIEQRVFTGLKIKKKIVEHAIWNIYSLVK